MRVILIMLTIFLLCQMLMNLHCNDKMNFDDGSCCKTADKTTTLQLVTLLFFVTWFVYIFL